MKPKTKLGVQLQNFNRKAGFLHMVQGALMLLVLNETIMVIGIKLLSGILEKMAVMVSGISIVR